MKALYLSTKGDDALDLPVPLEVENYLRGIVEMSDKVNTFKEDLFLCCDICEESFMGEIMMPVLRSIKRKTNGMVNNDISHMIWLRVMRPHISNIHLYISDEYAYKSKTFRSLYSHALLIIAKSSVPLSPKIKWCMKRSLKIP